MCGILGLCNLTSQTPLEMLRLRRALQRIRHRGPDDEGILLADPLRGEVLSCGGPDSDPRLSLPDLSVAAGRGFPLALGFRRLSILDLSPAGHQPMASPDEACWIVFNGEIYNYIELRTELQTLGCQFRTHTDTEVLLAAYHTWGLAMLPRLVGMFAFALLDLPHRRLLLARDFFGIKPLVYAEHAGRMAFASEPAALTLLLDLPRRANPAKLQPYLRYGITDDGEETLLQGVRQLPAAHYLLVSLDSSASLPAPQRYWEINPHPLNGISFEDAATEARRLFLQNIRLHLRSDVPVGAALSGGVDSSSIVAGMRAVQGPDLSLHTFSYIADQADINEERWVDIAAQAGGAQVHKIFAGVTDFAADLEALMDALGEPVMSTSMYAQYRVFQAARQAGITVMLDGQGADETLAGYMPFFSDRLGSLLRAGRWVSAARLARAARIKTAPLPMYFIFRGLKWLLPAPLSAVGRRLAGRQPNPVWLDNAWFVRRGVTFQPVTPPTSDRDVLRHELLTEVTRSGLIQLLRYEDRNSMAHSVESRVPFLTPELVTFFLSLPEEYLISAKAETKAVFRRAMRGIVPDAILNRQDKIGFATPEFTWLATQRDWVGGWLNGAAAARVRALNLPQVRLEWQEMLSGRRPYDSTVWRQLNLIYWAENNDVSFDES